MKILYYRQEDKLSPGIVTAGGVIGINNFSFAPGQKQYSGLALTRRKLEKKKIWDNQPSCNNKSSTKGRNIKNPIERKIDQE